MRKFFFQKTISLDGYFEGLLKELNWHNVEGQFSQYPRRFLRSVDLLLLGKITYQMMEAYWKSQEAGKYDSELVKPY
ncbi:MAG: hypothetical protein C5B59_02300 [Bacteroidetes bacterium]|nr:MAG: hypothetical protein C5B59_02300 [Bacteroidota bacterium]